MTPFILSFDNVGRLFGKLRAVDGVSFDVADGQIVGLIGPNGSGKTTLLNLASGLYEPSFGRILLMGQRVRNGKPHEIVRHGVARSFQNPRLFRSLDTVQHTVVALRDVTAEFDLRTAFGLFNAPWTRWTGEALSLLKEVFGSDVLSAKASTLPYGKRRLLELVRCLATKPKLLLLDEPTSGLNDEETEGLSALLLHLVREHSLTALIVDHKFSFLRGLCDSVVVMDHGRRIAKGTPEEIARDSNVNAIYFGEAP
jgi:branched-chain amino acid transport system ATP-binding protein